MVHHRLKLNRPIRKRTKDNNYEKMMKTLLLQNQQIIIQQQNMMFMVLKQLQHQSNPHQVNPIAQSQQRSSPVLVTMDDPIHQQQQTAQHHNQQQQHQHQHQQHNIPNQHSTHQIHTSHQMQPAHHLNPNNPHQLQAHARPQSQPIHSNGSSQQSSQHDQNGINHITLSQDLQQLQQVTTQLQENSNMYLTPATSEETPMDEKSDEQELTNFLENDGPLQNDLFYNPQTEIGQITPYKSHEQQETPSYYSSNNSCTESLTTPRVEQQRQPTISNINQAVVKNLSDSFKSPTKPKINIQYMSGSATGCMKNNKAKIIQRMNISEFLRHVHSENDDLNKTSTT